MNRYTLSRKTTGLMVIDVQEKIFPLVERGCEVLLALHKVVKGFEILHLPIVVTEQYPQGLGETVPSLKEQLSSAQLFTKTTFSCLGDEKIRNEILKLPISQWVLVGIEAHVCVLQSAKELLDAGKQVVVLNDAISSRSIYDYSTAIGELKDAGARISSVETILFELISDSKAPEFKQLSALIKLGDSTQCNSGCGCG